MTACAVCGEHAEHQTVTRDTHRGIVRKTLLVHTDAAGNYIARDHAAEVTA